MATLTIEADSISHDPARYMEADRYQLTYRAKTEQDARKRLAVDIETLSRGNLAPTQARWSPGKGFMAKGSLTVVFYAVTGREPWSCRPMANNKLTADELLSRDDIPESIKKVIRAEQRKTTTRRPVAFHIVSKSPEQGTEVVPGRRDFHEPR